MLETERAAHADGWNLRESYLFDRNVIAEIQRAAREGIYDIRGFGAKRPVPHFDDLLVLGASISRYPLEGYRERCGTDVVLGTRHAKRPRHLDIPITIAGMRFGALSANAKRRSPSPACGPSPAAPTRPRSSRTSRPRPSWAATASAASASCGRAPGPPSTT